MIKTMTFQESESSESSECDLKIVETDNEHSAEGSDDRETPQHEEREPVKKTKAKAAKAAAAASEVKVTTEDAKEDSSSSSSNSERVSKEETDSTREMLKTIVASLNKADAAKLLRRANLLEEVCQISKVIKSKSKTSIFELSVGWQAEPEAAQVPPRLRRLGLGGGGREEERGGEG